MPQKDTKLLHDLIENHAKTFAKLACKYGAPSEYAEDIAMDALWTFYNSHLYDGKEEEEARIIMTTIIKHKTIDHFRKYKKGKTPEASIDDEEFAVNLRSPARYEPEHTAVVNENYRHIVEVIENLMEIWRVPVKMYFVEQRTYAEISEALGISEDVCRSRISRARKVLEEELKDMLK